MEIECAGDAFQKLFICLADVLDEAILSIDANGVVINALDATRTIFVQMLLKPAFFKDYTVPAPERIKLNLNRVKEIIKRDTHYDFLHLQTDLHKNILSFKFHSKERKSRATINAKLVAILDEDEDKVPFPMFTPTASFTLKGKELKAVADLVKTDNYFTFDVADAGVTFSVENDNGESVLSLDSEDDLFLHKPVGAAKSMYSVEKFLSVAGFANLSTAVECKMGTEVPVYFGFDLGLESVVQVFIAPRVEEEESEEDHQKKGEQTDDEEEDEEAPHPKSFPARQRASALHAKHRVEPEEEEESPW
jgi:proliferating cell nuclear antigen PCNA